MGKFIDLKGQRFGCFVAIEYDNKKAKWKCLCDCGNIRYVGSYDLRNGLRVSCGCKYKDKHKEIKKDKRYKVLQQVYFDMKDRCYNIKCKTYSYYGGKGIRLDDIWLGNDGFANFFDWSINNGYDIVRENGRNTITIDRIDSNKNYSPDNCRWISNGYNIARSGKWQYKLEERVIELDNESEEKIIQHYYEDKIKEIEKNGIIKSGYFFRKSNHYILHNEDNSKMFLFRNYSSVAKLLKINKTSVSYRMRKKDGNVIDGWRLEKINKDDFNMYINKGIEVIR